MAEYSVYVTCHPWGVCSWLISDSAGMWIWQISDSSQEMTFITTQGYQSPTSTARPLTSLRVSFHFLLYSFNSHNSVMRTDSQNYFWENWKPELSSTSTSEEIKCNAGRRGLCWLCRKIKAAKVLNWNRQEENLSSRVSDQGHCGTAHCRRENM